MLPDEILALACDLMRFDTTSSNYEGIYDCMRFIKDYFEDTSLLVEEHTVDGKQALTISFGTKAPKVILNGHIDVVPAPLDLFNPVVKDGRLWGRGALDMKAAIAVMMLLMKKFADGEHHPDVALMIVGDEEVAGNRSTKALLEKGYLGEFFIAGEPTDLAVGNEAKGILQVKIRTRGVAAHGSQPWRGENAIEKTAQVIGALRKEFPDVKEGEWKTTLNVALIDGGDAVNKVPERCNIAIDIRHVPKDNPDDIIARIVRCAGDAEVGIIGKGSGAACDASHPHIAMLQDAAIATIGSELVLIKKTAASDARFYSEAGHAAIVFGPTGHGQHALDEWVDIGSLEMYYQILEEYCRRF